MIIDTDIFIWYMRGNKKAQQAIHGVDPPTLSVVSYIELVQGMRNKRELQALRKAFANWQARVVYINESISAKAAMYVEHHYLSQSMQLADALIAATAVHYAEPLLTGNDKHYRKLGDLNIEAFRPE